MLGRLWAPEHEAGTPAHVPAQVNSNSQGYTSGTAMNTPVVSAAGGGEDSPEPLTPTNGVVDESLAPGGQAQLAGASPPGSLNLADSTQSSSSLPFSLAFSNELFLWPPPSAPGMPRHSHHAAGKPCRCAAVLLMRLCFCALMRRHGLLGQHDGGQRGNPAGAAARRRARHAGLAARDLPLPHLRRRLADGLRQDRQHACAACAAQECHVCGAQRHLRLRRARLGQGNTTRML